MLAQSIPLECMEAIAWGHLEIVKHGGQVDVFQLSGGADRHVRRKPRRSTFAEQLLGAPIRKGLDQTIL